MKSKHYDAVLFFKVGNFYDLYHMDALLAAKELGITLMKRDHAHCRFSEGGEPDRFSKYSQLLVNKGYVNFISYYNIFKTKSFSILNCRELLELSRLKHQKCATTASRRLQGPPNLTK